MTRRYVVERRTTRWGRGIAALVRSGLAGPSHWAGAWVIGWITASAGAGIWTSMTHAGADPARCVGVGFLVGVVGGCAWQWLNRRDLVDRFTAVALLGIIGGLSALLWPGSASVDGRGVPTGLGLIAGNVVLEWWLRLPAQRERFGGPRNRCGPLDRVRRPGRRRSPGC